MKPALQRVAARLRDPWALGLGALLLGALVVRLWGIRSGLPFAYNIDERSHFVPRAVGLFSGGTLNPHYQLNPDGFIYLVAAALGLWYRGRQAVTHAYLTSPGEVYLIGRVVAALLGVAAVALLHAATRKLVGRWPALLAAALLAFTFLPVSYGHLALNDSPALAFIALALFGTAGVFDDGRRRWYVLAGLGVGLAAGVKYNAGIALLPIVAAAGVRFFTGGERAAALRGLALAGVGVVIGFIVADPYALIDHRLFVHELQHLSVYESGALLLGETQRSGFLYYLWSLTWGFGWVPLALSGLGAATLALARGAGRVRSRGLALVLVPAPVVFFLFNGSQGRYFARYMLPIFPMLCVLAAIGAAWLFGRLARERPPRIRRAVAAAVAVLALAQGLVFVVHNDIVLSRPDTRSDMRAWMLAHIPAGEKIVLEPTVPREWQLKDGHPQAAPYWTRFLRTRDDVKTLAREYRGAGFPADFANYQRTLWPGLIRHYREGGYCWIVSSSMQEGRAWRDPRRVPGALPYYRALRAQSTIAFHASPFGAPDAGPQHPFQFDWSFDYYPLIYERPGPVATVYHLKNCH